MRRALIEKGKYTSYNNGEVEIRLTGMVSSGEKCDISEGWKGKMFCVSSVVGMPSLHQLFLVCSL